MRKERKEETYHHVRATLGGVADGGGAPFDNEASRYRGWGRRCRCRRCRRGGARRLAGLGGRRWCNDGRRGHRLILVRADLVRCPADNAADDGHTCSRGRCRTRGSGQLIRRQRAPNVFSYNQQRRFIEICFSEADLILRISFFFNTIEKSNFGRFRSWETRQTSGDGVR